MHLAIRQGIRAELESYAFDPSCFLFLPFYRLDGDSFASQDKYGHLFTNRGMTWLPEGNYLDGTACADCPPNSGLDTARFVTFEAYVEFESFSSFNWMLGMRGAHYGYVFYVISSRLDFQPNGGTHYNSISTVPLNRPIHVAISYSKDAGEMSFYLNGQLDVVRTGFSSDLNTGGLVSIGALNSSPLYPCHGTFFFEAVYSRVLSSVEISRHAMAAKEAFG